MSEVAGRMATQVGARFLESHKAARETDGRSNGRTSRTRTYPWRWYRGHQCRTDSCRNGCEVLIADINLPRLRYLSEVMPKNVKTLYSSTHNIKMELPNIDLVIGSVLIPGDKAPHLITSEMLKMMKPGTVLVDVAIDQGGCFETSTHHAQRPYLHCGRNCTLRRCQYPRRRTLHLHHGTDKCHPALHCFPGMQRLETSLQGRPGSGARIERSGRQSNIQSCSRRLRAEI